MKGGDKIVYLVAMIEGACMFYLKLNTIIPPKMIHPQPQQMASGQGCVWSVARLASQNISDNFTAIHVNDTSTFTQFTLEIRSCICSSWLFILTSVAMSK